MPAPVRTPVVLHFSDSELLAMQTARADSFGSSRIQAVRRFLRGESATAIAEDLGHKSDWVRRVVRDYNVRGAEAFEDGRANNHGKRLLDDEGFAALREAVATGEPPGGGLWNSPKVAAWISQRIGRPDYKTEGLAYLKRLGYSKKVPRPAHAGKDTVAGEDFKKKSPGTVPGRRAEVP